MQFACQCLLLFVLILSFFNNLRTAIYGKEKREPMEFGGIVIYVVLVAMWALVLNGAGAFTTLTGASQ